MASAPRVHTRTLAQAILLAVAVLAAGGCATGRFARPVGQPVGIPTSDAEPIWAEATRRCASVDRYNAALKPSGRVAGGSIRGVRLNVAVTSTEQLGLEAVAGTQTLFVLKGTADRAQLWLPNERRVVTAPASNILRSWIGIDVDPARLLAVLSGCAAVDRRLVQAGRFDRVVRLTTADTTVFLGRHGASWRVVAADFGNLSVEYGAGDGDVPGRIRILVTGGGPSSVDLSLAVESVTLDADLPPDAFRVNVPADAVPAALSDLRPLGSRD